MAMLQSFCSWASVQDQICKWLWHFFAWESRMLMRMTTRSFCTMHEMKEKRKGVIDVLWKSCV
jgi:hypothetical protein